MSVTLRELLMVAATFLVTSILALAYGWLRSFLAKRLQWESPESQAIKKIAPAVDMLVTIIGPTAGAVSLLLDKASGAELNGNIKRVKKEIDNACRVYDCFLLGTSKISQKEKENALSDR